MILSRMGLKPSDAVNMLYAQIVQQRGIPFALVDAGSDYARTEYGLTEAELDRWIRRWIAKSPGSAGPGPSGGLPRPMISVEFTGRFAECIQKLGLNRPAVYAAMQTTATAWGRRTFHGGHRHSAIETQLV